MDDSIFTSRRSSTGAPPTAAENDFHTAAVSEPLLEPRASRVLAAAAAARSRLVSTGRAFAPHSSRLSTCLRILSDGDRSRRSANGLPLHVGEPAAKRRLVSCRKSLGPLGRSRALVKMIERPKPRLPRPRSRRYRLHRYRLFHASRITTLRDIRANTEKLAQCLQ
jgi:hypothetical protein